MATTGGAQLAQSEERVTFDLRVMSSRPMLRVEFKKKKKEEMVTTKWVSSVLFSIFYAQYLKLNMMVLKGIISLPDIHIYSTHLSPPQTLVRPSGGACCPPLCTLSQVGRVHSKARDATLRVGPGHCPRSHLAVPRTRLCPAAAVRASGAPACDTQL